MDAELEAQNQLGMTGARRSCAVTKKKPGAAAPAASQECPGRSCAVSKKKPGAAAPVASHRMPWAQLRRLQEQTGRSCAGPYTCPEFDFHLISQSHHFLGKESVLLQYSSSENVQSKERSHFRELGRESKLSLERES